MVQDSGKTLHTNPVKLNDPQPLQVREDKSGFPLTVKTTAWQRVASIEDRWRIDDEWWRKEPISRMYYAVILASGQKMVIYKDLIDSRWLRQK